MFAGSRSESGNKLVIRLIESDVKELRLLKSTIKAGRIMFSYQRWLEQIVSVTTWWIGGEQLCDYVVLRLGTLLLRRERWVFQLFAFGFWWCNIFVTSQNNANICRGMWTFFVRQHGSLISFGIFERQLHWVFRAKDNLTGWSLSDEVFVCERIHDLQYTDNIEIWQLRMF